MFSARAKGIVAIALHLNSVMIYHPYKVLREFCNETVGYRAEKYFHTKSNDELIVGGSESVTVKPLGTTFLSSVLEKDEFFSTFL